MRSSRWPIARPSSALGLQSTSSNLTFQLLRGRRVDDVLSNYQETIERSRQEECMLSLPSYVLLETRRYTKPSYKVVGTFCLLTQKPKVNHEMSRRIVKVRAERPEAACAFTASLGANTPATNNALFTCTADRLVNLNNTSETLQKVIKPHCESIAGSRSTVIAADRAGNGKQT